jgi:hypothetical protein
MNKHPHTTPDRSDDTRGKDRRDRLDSIEEADNRTERLDPERASATTDPIEDMLDADESNADYKDEAHRVSPTLGPSDTTDEA